MRSYRKKIYKYYSSSSIRKLAPDSLDGFKPRESYLKKIIKDHFPVDSSARILELGCGHGALQHYIALAGYSNSVGVDTSEEQIKEARRLGIQNVLFSDLSDYMKNMEDVCIDLLIIFDVLEHFDKDEISALIDEFYRVLKVGGKIICHAPNGEGPFGNFMRTWDFTHEIAFTRRSIAQIFLASGFSEVTSYEDKPTPHGLKSIVRYLLWEYFIRNICRLFMIIEKGRCDKEAIFSQNFLSVIVK